MVNSLKIQAIEKLLLENYLIKKSIKFLLTNIYLF